MVHRLCARSWAIEVGATSRYDEKWIMAVLSLKSVILWVIVCALKIESENNIFSDSVLCFHSLLSPALA